MYLRSLDGDGDRTPLALRPFGSGHSGFTYAVEMLDQPALVIRLSPPDVRIAGPADIGRQGRIMTALHAAGVPVPRIVACSSAPVIDGRSFALMEIAPGTDWEHAVAKNGASEVAAATIRTLRALTEISLESTGIGDERVASPTDEVTRWAWLLTKAPAHLHERGRALESILHATVVDPSSPCLVHGDFHLANLLFANGKVSAILDWEIAEIGDPLVDLGSLAVTALRPRYAQDPNPTGDLELAPAQIAALYGADDDRARWFTALSCLKYSAILGYNLQLHRSGRRPDSLYENLLTTMSGLLDDGLALAAGELDGVWLTSAIAGDNCD